MLDIETTTLVVVDVQGKLAQLMHDKEILFKNIQILIKAATILDIPILWCQQCPEALGPTVPEIEQFLSGSEPINKSSFSCCGEEEFNSRLDNSGRKQVLLCGIETHVCVYQTAVDLHDKGYCVNVIADAVSSRTQDNKHIALQKITAAGIDVTCTEMAIFELLRTAEHPKFKQIAKMPALNHTEDWIITFMPKVSMTQAGNGMHIHQMIKGENNKGTTRKYAGCRILCSSCVRRR